MGREASRLLALGAIAGIVLCGGAVWLVAQMFWYIDDHGDGLVEVDDPRPARAVVRVTDDAGRPLADAHVDAFHEPPWWGDFQSKFGFDPASEPQAAFAVSSGADGVATFAELGSGDWVIAARAPGRATEFARVRGGHAARLDVRLDLGVARTLRGRVTDSDGNAVADAVVLAYGGSDRHFQAAHWLASNRARCGPTGEFEFDDLPSGVASLWTVTPGDVPVESGRVLVPSCARIDLVVPTNRTKAVVHVQTDAFVPRPRAPGAAARIRGTVVSADGARIDGACVAALHHGEYGSDEEFAWAWTGPDGAFALDGVPADASVAIHVSARGHRATTTSWTRADAFADAATYTLGAGARIEGTVSTPDGAAPRDVRVWIYRLGEDRQTAFDALSVLWAGCPMWWLQAPRTPVGNDGRFETTWDYEAGPLVAYAVAEGFAPTVSAPFRVGADAQTVRVNLVLDSGVTFRGRLLGPDGTPLAQCPVRIRPPAFVPVWGATAAMTDSDGRFSISHVPARPVVVTVGGPLAAELRGATVAPSADEIEIRLARRPDDPLDPASRAR